MSVLHGTGKPEITIITSPIHTNTVKGVVSNVLELNTAVDLANLDNLYGLANYTVFTKTSTDSDIMGYITSYSETGGDFITVGSWTGGTPAIGKAVTIKDNYLRLPRAQVLTEGFTPDFIYKKLFNGRIVRIKRGWYYYASLDYSGYITENDLIVIGQLLKKDKQNIYFFPRGTSGSAVYLVDLAPETEILLRQAPHYDGHLSFILNLVGVERLSEIPFKASAEGGYGDSYGTDYGTNL